MEAQNKVIDFDFSDRNPFGSFSDDPFFIICCILIFFVLTCCVCRLLFSPKEALCYETKINKE